MGERRYHIGIAKVAYSILVAKEGTAVTQGLQYKSVHAFVTSAKKREASPIVFDAIASEAT